MMKRERVNRRQYLTRSQARADVFDYIECLYNAEKRRKPEQMEIEKLNLTKLSGIMG